MQSAKSAIELIKTSKDFLNLNLQIMKNSSKNLIIIKIIFHVKFIYFCYDMKLKVITGLIRHYILSVHSLKSS